MLSCSSSSHGWYVLWYHTVVLQKVLLSSFVGDTRTSVLLLLFSHFLKDGNEYKGRIHHGQGIGQ